MASFNDNPVLAELDQIASALEKTGNADLATLVDECSAEIQTAPPKRAASKRKPKRKRPQRSKKNRKSAGASRTRGRQKIAAAMKKIARAQVSELEDIAVELLNEGEKHAALEVLRIAEDLDSDYEYSKHGDHEKPESKGDADKRYDREKNLPKPKGDDPKIDYPFEEGEGYPFTDGGEKSAFTQQLDALIRLAMEEDMDMPMSMPKGEDEEMGLGEEDDEMDLGEEGDEEEGDEEEGDEEEGDEGEGMPLIPEEEAEDDDELADFLAMMEGMPEDVTSEGRMYEADEEPGDDELDLGGLDLGEEDDEMDLGEEGEEGEEPMPEEDMPEMDEDLDTEALDIMPNIDLKGPMGMGVSVASAQDKKRVVALAQKLHARGQTKLAKRVVSLLKKKSK